MDRGRQREIAQKGGKAAHVRGTAHEWSREEARAAGRKGGLASHRPKPEDEPMVPPSVDEMHNHQAQAGEAFRPTR